MQLSNKNVLVIGASGRIGKELCKSILYEGANVFAADRMLCPDISALIDTEEKSSNRIRFLEVDVTDENQIISLFRELPSLNGVVNCSYPMGENYGTDFLKQDLASFNSTLTAHLGSAFLVTQQAVRKFLDQREMLSIVNFSSIYGSVAPRFEIYAGTEMTTPIEYPLMKAAIERLNGYVSKYVKDSRLRINTISPGGVFSNQPTEFLDGYRSYTRGKGMLDAQDVCGAVLFLISENSKYVTGQNILVDDGFFL